MREETTAETTGKLRRTLGFRDLALFYISGSIGMRWIATAAAAGQSSIVVWLLALIVFFLPLAGCVLELSSRYPQEGGIYVWTREAYGDFAGFMAGWLYWMANLPYFPAVLYFAAGSLLFVWPQWQSLANSHLYYLIFTASALTVVTALNVAGLNVGKWLNNLGALGMILPIGTLLGAGILSSIRFGSATHFSLRGMMPHTHIQDLIFWSTIFFAYAGCEAGSFMGDEIRDARRTVPRALLAGGVVIAFTYIAGTIAMLVALPAASINGLSGFMSGIDLLCRKVGLGLLVAPVALLVALSSVGGMASVLSSTARLPFVAGLDHYLPPVFGRIHPRSKAPYVALIAYGLLGTLFGLLGQAGTSVAGAYDLLVSMSVVTFFIPYLFLFASVFRLQAQPFPPGAMRLPGGRRMAGLLASLGLFSTAATIVLALFPSRNELHPVAASAKVLGMTLVMLAAGAAVYGSGKRAKRRAALSAR